VHHVGILYDQYILPFNSFLHNWNLVRVIMQITTQHSRENSSHLW